MELKDLQQTIRQELPKLMRADPEFRAYILEISRQNFADKAETESRFDRILNELQRDREEQTRKWEANEAKLQQDREEQRRNWEANEAKLQQDREEQRRKWEANEAKLQQDREEQRRKWEANEEKWKAERAANEEKWKAEIAASKEKWKAEIAANEEKWKAERAANEEKWKAEIAADKEERQQHLAWVTEQLDKNREAMEKRIDRRLGALGARWGLSSEAAFRNALAGILEDNFDIEVVNITDYDDEGTVFGHPEQIELDIIIRNGTLLICELKSSMDKGAMYTFERKARFYEQRHNRKADKLIAISPMIEPKAQAVADKLGIITYSDSDDVDTL